MMSTTAATYTRRLWATSLPTDVLEVASTKNPGTHYFMRVERTAGARLRPWIAVVLSYAMLLQAFLIGVATTAAAAENSQFLGAFIICSANGDQSPTPLDGSGRAPIRHGTCLLCLMAGGGPAVLPPTAASVLVAAVDVVSLTPFMGRNVVYERHTPRQSQGPPRTV
jgi:hypothetical protein